MRNWDEPKIHESEEIYKKHVPGEYGELIHRFRVPGGWIYTHSIQMFGGSGWGQKRAHVMDTFVPDPPNQGEK
jgi:hypothetical protein